MTFVGKLFVLCNLALSLMLGVMGFGVYLTGIDWSADRGKAGLPDGKLFSKRAELDDILKSQLPVAEASWRQAGKELWDSETVRRIDRDWYVEQLNLLIKGNNPVMEVVRDKIDPRTGRPVLAPAEESAGGNPLLTLPVYQTQLAEVRAENARLREQLETKVKEDVALTNKLLGDKEAQLRGLRELLVQERRIKQQGILAEKGVVEGMRINATVDSELIFKRLELINERIDELHRYLKLRHGVDTADKDK